MALEPIEEQDRQAQAAYARWLDVLVRIAFVLSVLTLLLYVSGALAPQVPLAQLPELWVLPLGEYLARTGAPTGWHWLELIQRGDYLNMAAIALFAAITLACYLRVIPLWLRPQPRLQAALAMAQVVVLLVAMCGVFAGG